VKSEKLLWRGQKPDCLREQIQRAKRGMTTCQVGAFSTPRRSISHG